MAYTKKADSSEVDEAIKKAQARYEEGYDIYADRQTLLDFERWLKPYWRDGDDGITDPFYRFCEEMHYIKGFYRDYVTDSGNTIKKIWNFSVYRENARDYTDACHKLSALKKLIDLRIHAKKMEEERKLAF